MEEWISVICLHYDQPNPQELYKSDRPIGMNNDTHILEAAKSCDRIIVAWGNHGSYINRGNEVLTLLSESFESNIYTLAKTKTMQPVHPLYQKGDIIPERWYKS